MEEEVLDLVCAGVTVKSVWVNFGPGGPDLLAILVRRTKNATKFGPPPDPFCWQIWSLPTESVRLCRVYNLQIECIKKITSKFRDCVVVKMGSLRIC